MRKRRKRIKRLIARLVVLLLVLSLAGGVLFGLFRLSKHLFFSRNPIQEDEKLHLSPPNEEILFVRPQNGIYISDPQARNIRQLTSANDIAPSWKLDGTGFYFLRQNPARELHLMYYDYKNGQLSESSLATFTMMELPNPEGDMIKIAPDGKSIAVSSYDWGVQLIEVATHKVVSRSFKEIWDFWGFMSRNSKFCLLTIRPHPKPLQLVSGAGAFSTKNSLWLCETDLRSTKLIDESDQSFQGVSFSMNGYTFAYAKNGQIFYVDSIQQIKPALVSDGIQPAIRPAVDPKKYRLIKPFWLDFDISNLVGMLSWSQDEKEYLVWATPNYLSILDLNKQQINHYTEGKKKESYLGWKLMDFYLSDINGNQKKELLTSWWPGGSGKGAERISFFSLDTSSSTIKEIFRSQGKFRNTIQITDLNGDGIKDVLNMYSDVSGEGNAALDALIWTDVYTWDGAGYQLSNERFEHVYMELVESYRSFLAQALRDPDSYGSGLVFIRQLLQRANAILDQEKTR